MQQKERAIVLHSIKHKESGYIIKLFTESEGVISAMMYISAKGKKRNLYLSCASPLSLCSVELSKQKKSSMTSIKEIQANPLLYNCRSNPRLSPIMNYMAGFVNLITFDNQTNIALFNWLWAYIEKLENGKPEIKNIPLHFTCQLLDMEGYLPSAIFSSLKESHSEIDEINQALIQICSQRTLEQLSSVDLTGKSKCLQYLINHTAMVLQNQRIKDLYAQTADLYH